MKTAQNTFSIDQDFEYSGNDWWKWSVWIEAEDKDLDAIDHVIYTLHTTFPNPVRTITSRHTKFKLITEGWGVFRIYARLCLKDKSEIFLEHDLYLEYPDGTESTE